MHPKGGEMLHTIRQLVNDDEKWRGIPRGREGGGRDESSVIDQSA